MSNELSPASTAEARMRVCSFFLNDICYAVDVRLVSGVVDISPDDILAVPQAPAAIRGLSTIRGQIVAVIELNDVLSLDERVPPDSRPLALLLERPYCALLIDRFHVVEPVDEIVPLSGNDAAAGSEFVAGTLKPFRPETSQAIAPFLDEGQALPPSVSAVGPSETVLVLDSGALVSALRSIRMGEETAPGRPRPDPGGPGAEENRHA